MLRLEIILTLAQLAYALKGYNSFPHEDLDNPRAPVRILDCSALTGGRATCRQSADGVEVTLNGAPGAVDMIAELNFASSAAVIDCRPSGNP